MVLSIEKRCERCWKLYIAKSWNQKYDLKCSNIIYKERSKLDSEKSRLRTKQRKERLLKKEG